MQKSSCLLHFKSYHPVIAEVVQERLTSPTPQLLPVINYFLSKDP